MAKNMAPNSEHCIHMLMKGDSELYLVTNSLEAVEANLSRNKSLRSFLDVDPLVVAQFLEGRMPWQIVDNDAAWKAIAPAIQTFHKHLQVYEECGETPTYTVIPPDIPMPMAIGRGDVMETHPQLSDIPAALEVSEVVIAAKNRRKADTSLFRPESLEVSWASLHAMDPRALAREAQFFNRELMNQKNTSSLDFAIDQQHLRELHFVLDSQEAELNDW